MGAVRTKQNALAHRFGLGLSADLRDTGQTDMIQRRKRDVFFGGIKECGQ